MEPPALARDLPDESSAARWSYQAEPIPCALDVLLATHMDALLAGTNQQREHAAASLGPHHVAALLTFVERTASSAVRHRDRTYVARGLLAIALLWRSVDDPCDALPALGALADAARRVDGSASVSFEAASQVAPADAAPVFRDFLRRRDLEQIATVMGYIDAADAGGFRYVRTW